MDDRHRGSHRRQLGALFLILGVALALRLGWAVRQPAGDGAIDALPDQREYLSLARNLRAGEGLQFFDARFGEVVYAFRSPGYPIFLATLNANVRWVRVAQAMVDASCVLAVYLLARRLLDQHGTERLHATPSVRPLVAAALVAFNPFLIYFSGLLLSETVFTAMLAWGMVLLVVGAGSVTTTCARPSHAALYTSFWLAGGVLLAASALVRPSAAPLPLLLGYGSVFLYRARPNAYAEHRSPGFRWPLPVGATMLLLIVLVLAPWAYRNARVLGRWVWTTTNGGITAYDGLNPDATGASNQSFIKSMPQLRAMGEVERSDYLSAKAAEYIRAHPGRTAHLALVKAGRTWSPVPLSREYGDWKHRAVGLLYGVPFYAMTLLGLWTGSLSRAAKVFLLLPAIYFTAVHMASVGSLRYRIPVEPPMAVIAASAIRPSRLAWKRAGEKDESET